MTLAGRRGGALAVGLLALLPLLAHASALGQGRLLGPGDGAALHYPLRVAAWTALPDVPSWNPWIFGGAPLLAGYRVGALYPLFLALAGLPTFTAFNALVLVSMSLSGVLTFVYLRSLGAHTVGAYVSGLSFSLGPYAVGHAGDTSTLVAAPLLPLLLTAAEAHLRRPTPARTAGVSVALALLLVAGSPEAVGAGGLLLGVRLLVGHLGRREPPGPSVALTLGAVLGGLLLASPQLLPTLLALRDAGHGATGLAGAPAPTPPGLTGQVLRYVSHTPAPALALAALPLLVSHPQVRVFGLALLACLCLQRGRGPLAAPGALSLAFDLVLSVLAGLSLSAQWRARRDALGGRLRAYFLISSLASAAALSVSAAALGPLPERLAPAVGILALSSIAYLSLAGATPAAVAGLWLLPLTVSFLLQPDARGVWDGAPTRRDLEEGTSTAQSLQRLMGGRKGERTLCLVREWPRREEKDLVYGDLGVLSGRRNANGYEPLVPWRTRRAFDGMTAAGILPGAFFRTDPARLELLGVRWVEVPTSALTTQANRGGLGDTLDMLLEAGRPRSFPLPITTATEVRISSLLSEAEAVQDGAAVARVRVDLASGRALELFVRAGEDTAEWAYDRPDVARTVAHRRARVLESWPDPQGFAGHRYLGVLKLPGRYVVDGLEIERLPGPGRFMLSRLGVVDAKTGDGAPVSLTAAYVSDQTHFRPAANTPGVRLFEVPHSLGHARVTERLRILADEEAVLRALAEPERNGFEARRETLVALSDAAGVVVPEGARSSRAEVVRAAGAHLAVEAEGPGMLVVAESWDRGWSAAVDDRSAEIHRVNHAQMGIVLAAGTHYVTLAHQAPGFREGLLLFWIGAAGLVLRIAAAGRRILI